MIDFYPKSRKEKYQKTAAGVSHICRDCDKKRRKIYVGHNKLKLKHVDRKYHLARYGLTPETYSEILASQNNACFTCKKPQAESTRNLVIDHDHNTGKVRGILCIECNLALGHAKDDIKILLNLIKYLQRSESAETISDVSNCKIVKESRVII